MSYCQDVSSRPLEMAPALISRKQAALPLEIVPPSSVVGDLAQAVKTTEWKRPHKKRQHEQARLGVGWLVTDRNDQDTPTEAQPAAGCQAVASAYRVG
ncbi:hypothetical protein J6590_031514 [Homalodisca vitripennis]|nr:hypothetical protein J6590_031514 [Homalodisca vitripennis]